MRPLVGNIAAISASLQLAARISGASVMGSSPHFYWWTPRLPNGSYPPCSPR